MRHFLSHSGFLKSILWILHIVGAAGTIYPPTREYVVPLTPANLLLSVVILGCGHRQSTRSLLYFFIWAFMIGMAVEIIGVQTGFPFGDYYYGEVLGPKVTGVPWLIGINWFMLAYAFGQLVKRWIKTPLFGVLLGGLAMALIDVLIEPVAIHLQYWTWASETVPLQNYLSWFVIGAFIQIPLQWNLWQSSRQNSTKSSWNPLSPTLVFAQILYFSVVFIFSKL